ncbi:MAG: hypothetical protein H0U52_15670 [Chloroflexi bacterium]|nr:hypothetical protein [Chloroflexota bacterium]
MNTHSKTGAAAGHTFGVIAQAILVAAIVALTALALSPVLGPAASIAGVDMANAGSSASSVWIESSSGARLANGGLQFNDPFDVGYATRERKPWAHAVCFPNASTVYSTTKGDGSVWGMYYSVYAGGPQEQAFVAGESVDGNWASGGADCRVDLLKFSSDYARSTVLASSSFTVAP